MCGSEHLCYVHRPVNQKLSKWKMNFYYSFTMVQVLVMNCSSVANNNTTWVSFGDTRLIIDPCYSYPHLKTFHPALSVGCMRIWNNFNVRISTTPIRFLCVILSQVRLCAIVATWCSSCLNLHNTLEQVSAKWKAILEGLINLIQCFNFVVVQNSFKQL